MSRPQLVSDSYEDASDSSENASEFEDAERVGEDGRSDDYINELEERKKYVQEFINKSFRHFKKGLDFGSIHDQDMNYYQETSYTYNDDRPMLGPVDDDSLDAVSDDGPDYDPDYDEEVNRLLDEVDKEILQDNSSASKEEDEKAKNYSDPKREQYEDCYDEFPEDIHHVGPIPSWYQKMLQSKVKETKNRLVNLSNLVCYACATTGAHIKRIEQDHGTTFCKMDHPRHPPLNKPWINFWKFNCMIKCREIDKPNHAHTADCESVLLEHAGTGVSTLSKNISENEYPKFVMDAVELFQDFAIETTKSVPFLDSKEAQDTVYEKPVWTEMKLRSNYKNELLIVVRGKGVTSLISKLKRYFDSGPGRSSNVIAVYCINQKWSQKKSNFPPSYVTGIFKVRDKVGPISINYEPKTNVSFNSVEAIQLGKIIEDYAQLTKETTLLDVGCNFGVLSLMMSHRCDRVIGLNTMHFVSSEISQAEELKKFNNIHNVSFMGCDPKDVLTKCSSIVKRSPTVAILNLASPYGKSIHVMQALRDLPTIWKIIVYGSFTKDYHRNISMLTSKDDSMGDHYLPMQGCILDKSPTVANAFDIVILFERKSLIETEIKLLAPGPTLNAKDDSDSYSYGSLDDQDVKPIIKLERGFGKPDYRSKKFTAGKPFIKYRVQVNKFGKFDSPMLPMDDTEPEPENSQKKSQARSPSPAATERKFDCSVLRQNPPAVPPAQNGNDKGVYTSIRKELQVKELKRKYDSPYLPIEKEETPETNRKRSPPPSAKDKLFDCSVLKKEKPFDCSVLKKEKAFDCSVLKREKPFDCSVLKKEKPFDCSMLRNHEKPAQQNRHERPIQPHGFLAIKKEFQMSCPTPPREKFPSPPPPPPPPLGENGFPRAPQIKKEKDSDYPLLAKVKAEPMDLCDDDKEEGELSPEYDAVTTNPVKPKALDPSYFVGFSETTSGSSSQAVTVKSEPADSYRISASSVRVKNEPEDMQISPNPEDIQNMETPIHQPRALSGGAYPLPLATATNFTTVDGHEFSVRANQSFLPFKPEAGAAAIKTEPRGLERDEEIKIIGEKNVAAQPSEPRIRVKSLDEIIKTKSESEPSDDLRTLIEKRKTIQRRLDRALETHCYRDLNGRSPSPDLPRRYKRKPSSSPPPFRKYNRSPSPHAPYRKYNRSPSPPAAFRKYNRSPSPHSRHRSPIARRYRRSPSPPARTRIKRSRSPSPTRTWVKREKSPVGKRWRRSPSPSDRRRRRSPSPIRFKRDSRSPVAYKRSRRSPSPSSSSSYKSLKSPVKSRHDRRKRLSRSRSPTEVKRRRASLSPITLSPSPPRKRDGSKDRKRKEEKKEEKKRKEEKKEEKKRKEEKRGEKKRKEEKKEEKKKRKTKSKSRSPSRASKSKSKTTKDDSNWDIPVLSTLPSSPKTSDQVSVPKVEAAVESIIPSEQTKPVKQENASRSKSPSPVPETAKEDAVKAEVAAE